MLTHSTQRWLAVLGVAGAFVAASAAPAVAADPLRVLASDHLVAPGARSWNSIDLTLGGERPEDGLFSLDLDMSKLNRLATLNPLSPDVDCDQIGETLHCEGPVKGVFRSTFEYSLLGKAGAIVGDKADLPITARYAGQTASRTITVTIAEGVDLESQSEDVVNGEPGTVAGLTSTVHNVGEATTHGAVLVLQPHQLSPYVGNFSNCTYRDGAPVICRFDTDLEPAKSYQLSAPLPVHLDASARTGTLVSNYLTWWTKDDWALVESNPDSPLPPGKPGTGKELRLVEDSGQHARGLQTDVRPNNFTEFFIRVTGDNPADLAAVGWTTTAKIGDKVEVKVGMKNLGPAYFESWAGHSNLSIITVHMPPGTTVVTVSEDCAPKSGPGYLNLELLGRPGYESYGCLPTNDLTKGAMSEYRFTLHIDKLAGKTSGVVQAHLEGDPRKANDTAAITIKPKTAGQGGGEGSLPITGSSARLIAGIGGLLLVAGIGSLLVARRRRTRFVGE